MDMCRGLEEELGCGWPELALRSVPAYAVVGRTKEERRCSGKPMNHALIMGLERREAFFVNFGNHFPTGKLYQAKKVWLRGATSIR